VIIVLIMFELLQIDLGIKVCNSKHLADVNQSS